MEMMPPGEFGGEQPGSFGGGPMPEGFEPEERPEMPEDFGTGERPEMPADFEPGRMPGGKGGFGELNLENAKTEFEIKAGENMFIVVSK